MARGHQRALDMRLCMTPISWNLRYRLRQECGLCRSRQTDYGGYSTLWFTETCIHTRTGQCESLGSLVIWNSSYKELGVTEFEDPWDLLMAGEPVDDLSSKDSLPEDVLQPELEGAALPSSTL